MVGQSVKPLRIRFFHANSRLKLEVMVYRLSQVAYPGSQLRFLFFGLLCSPQYPEDLNSVVPARFLSMIGASSFVKIVRCFTGTAPFLAASRDSPACAAGMPNKRRTWILGRSVFPDILLSVLSFLLLFLFHYAAKGLLTVIPSSSLILNIP